MRIHPEMWGLGGVIVLGLVLGGFALAKHANNAGTANSAPQQNQQPSQPDTTRKSGGVLTTGLIQKCPSGWYENKMPQVVPPGQSPSPQDGYLIIDGKNYPESQVDLDWVRKNCEINQPDTVY